MSRKIGMWLYSNSGGDKIQRKIIKKLKERDIETVKDINLRHAVAKNGHIVKDYGTHSLKSCDYPQIGFKVAQAVAAKKAERGLLICKTGIGQSIVANKVPGIRAAVCLM